MQTTYSLPTAEWPLQFMSQRTKSQEVYSLPLTTFMIKLSGFALVARYCADL